jgi:arabinogalactan oligomer/maltooligosaccharide transport system substrate-binding protein
MYKRKITEVIGALVSATMLASCGTTNSVEDVSEMETQTTPVSEGTVTLKVWGAEEDEALLTQIIESFKTEYAGQADFDITYEAQDESSCRDVYLADPENSADVFTFVDDQLLTYVAAGAISPVPNADEIRSANSDAASDACSINGTLYAYPMTADNGYFMYYNKAYFSDEDVQSLDNMLEIAAANGKKVAFDFSSGWYVYSFWGQTGMTVGLNDDGITNYCDWNSKVNDIKGIDVATAIVNMLHNDGLANLNDADFIAGVEDGSVIAGVNGAWNANKIEEVWGSNYGATKLPTYNCGGQQVQMSSFAGYKMVGVNAYSENEAWAHKLADWITNEDNQKLRFEIRGQGPSNNVAAASDAVSESPAIQALLAQSEYASLQRIGGNYWTPVSEFTATLEKGDPTQMDLQTLLDNMVDSIAATYGY